MRLVWIGLFAAAAVAVGVVGRATRDPPPPLGALTEEVVTAGAPGALVLVRAGRETRAAAAGAAQLAPRRRRLRAGDRFRVASVTKVFTAALVLQLVAEDRLVLADPVDRWLPGLLEDGAKITVRDLLGHRSGLYDHTDLPAVYNVDRTWSPAQLVALSARRPRSAGFAYSSTNYVILGMLIERVTGRPYAAVLRERITGPLGLRSTRFEPSGRIAGAHAHGHVPAVHDGFVRPAGPAADRDADSASWGGTAGAIVSTAGDVAAFLDALLDGRVVPPRLVAAMVPPVRAGRRSYGLGLVAHPLGCGHGVGHTGNLLGTITVAYRIRERTVVAMTNQHPLTAAADAAFRRLVERAACE